MRNENGIEIDATLIYTGMPDFWSGDGDRWDEDKGCLFAYYDHGATRQDIIDGWVDDWNSGGDFDGKPLAEDISDEDLRKALESVWFEGTDLSEGFEPAGLVEPMDDDDCDCELQYAVALVTLTRSEDSDEDNDTLSALFGDTADFPPSPEPMSLPESMPDLFE